ncbi:MAG TPA: macro domain-containing protein [Candidatus Babeliales bacterium]|nr:macro domain-containing protein [Candidatus Babeliales bacterium]
MKFLQAIVSIMVFLSIGSVVARGVGGQPAAVPVQQDVQPSPLKKITPAIPAPAEKLPPEDIKKVQHVKKTNGPRPRRINRTRITIVQGDITQQKVDAIVNAVNEDLSHGGGVAAAIAKAAGPELQKYSHAMPIMSGGKRCPTGKAVITPAFNLEKVGVKKIVHATGPRGDTPNKEQLLRDAYLNSLQVAQDNGLKSIAFPAISTAIFGYDINEATPVAFAAVSDFVKTHPGVFNEVRFVLYSDKDLAVYKKYENMLRVK